MGTESPDQRPTKTIPTLVKNEITTEESLDENNDYYYVYENLPNYPAPDEVMDFLNNFGVEQTSPADHQSTTTTTTAKTTTERKVPTLHVEEILPKADKTSTTLTPPKE